MITIRHFLIRLPGLLSPRLRRVMAIIRDSRLFDSDWYLDSYPDVAGVDPLLHYVRFGEAEGRSPNPLFDPAFYRSQADPGDETALGHFATIGWKQGIAPHPLFDMTYYRERYPDVTGNPLVHFLEQGEAREYEPHPLFQTSYYRAQLQHAVARPVAQFLREGKISPYPLFDPVYYGNSLVHYLTSGANNGRDPHPLFSTNYYSRRYRAMLQGMNPLVHYAKIGGVLPHQPHPLFDPEFYRRQRPEAAKTGYPMLIAYVESDGDVSPHPLFDPAFYREQAGKLSEPPLAHYIRSGDRMGLWPNRMFDTSFYKSRHPDLGGMTALEHYIEHCFEPGADPHPSFSTTGYMRRVPALAPGETPLEHYLASGACSHEATPGPDMTVDELQRAFDRAREGNSDVVIVTAPFRIGDEALEAMRRLIALDPYFGFVTPRLSWRDSVRNLDGAGYLPAGSLAGAPEFYIPPELISPCWLIRREVVKNAPPLDRSFSTAAGALFHLLYRMRRTGYRCVVANRVVVPMPDAWTPSMAAIADMHRLSTEEPDNLRARQEFANHPAHRHEALLAEKRTMLLDGRGIPAGFNGTSEFALRLLDGIETTEHDWQITLLINPGVDEFHGLARRYPKLRVTTAMQGRFAVALRLSQPWYPDTIRQLHDLALFNAHFVYDTIAWDTIYPAPANLTETWSFLAQHSDALIYISDFTRQRFRMRFPPAASVRDHVCYPSLYAADYVRARAEDGEYLLIAGNEYDHKSVASCVAALKRTFPHLPLSVQDQPIGDVPQAAVEERYARAKAIVFPSFYEGFGFPLVRGLAYGKTVFVRSSELVNELTGLYRGPGTVVTFESPEELAAAVQSFLNGQPPGRAGKGSGPSPDWRTSARTLLGFVEEMVGQPASSRWLTREEAFRQMASWRS